MSEPNHSPNQTSPERETISMSFADTPASSGGGEARIEDYLDHVCAPLVGVIPYERRTAIRAEMRLHLDSLIAAHEELGVMREEAVEAALRQFGAPKTLSRRWLEEWDREGLTDTSRSAWLATKVALCWYGGTTVVPALALGAFCALQKELELGRAVDPVVGLLQAAAFGLPLLGGFAVGLKAPTRPLRGTINALAFLIPVSVALGERLMFWADPSRPYWMYTAVLSCTCYTFYLPLCCWMAFKGRQKQRVLKHRQLASS